MMANYNRTCDFFVLFLVVAHADAIGELNLFFKWGGAEIFAFFDVDVIVVIQLQIIVKPL